MLEAAAGEPGSYLEIVDAIERNSSRPGEELAQLWRRIAFSVLISNTDDHLRNHGFLRTSTAGWSLSPAFDLNPNPEVGPKQLSTAIDYDDPTASIDLLMNVAEHFRLGADEASSILAQVSEATARWRATARDAGLEPAAIEGMSSAFEHEQAEIARRVTA